MAVLVPPFATLCNARQKNRWYAGGMLQDFVALLRHPEALVSYPKIRTRKAMPSCFCFIQARL